MEVLVLLQRDKLNSLDYHKLTNIKANIGLNSLLQNNIPLQLHSLRSLLSHVIWAVGSFSQ